jgi:hypothetical protein
MTTFDRPVEAKLHVQLANGDSWEAREEDLERFGLVKLLDAYSSFAQQLSEALECSALLPTGDLTSAQLNPVRYLAELAICFPDLLSHSDTAGTMAQIIDIEWRLLSSAAAEPGATR